MKTTLQTLKAAALSLFVYSTCALTVTSCERDESVKEKVKDGLDTRPNEGIKDAAEDTKDAVKDAAGEVKDAVKDAKN